MTATQNEEKEANSTAKNQSQKGFFSRVFQKLDDSMKQKAETKSQQGNCCGGSDDKGNKCC